MSITGFVTQQVRDNSDLTHGEITSLPFGNGSPFSVMMVSKVSPGEMPSEPVMLNCRLIADKSFSPLWLDNIAFAGQDAESPWSERNIAYISDSAANQTLLSNFRLFWASGEYSPAIDMFINPNIGYISAAAKAKANNILSHGKIESLPFGHSTGFFRVLLLPKNSSSGISFPDKAEMIDCKLRGDSEASLYHVFTNNSSNRRKWTDQTIWQISDTPHNQTILSQFDMYWSGDENLQV